MTMAVMSVERLIFIFFIVEIFNLARLRVPPPGSFG
jgi:hypothetical protein